MVERICVNMSAVSVTSTSTLSEGCTPNCRVFRIGGVPWRMFISIGVASETWAPAFFTACQPTSDMPVMWMNRLSSTNRTSRWPVAMASNSGCMPKLPTMCDAMSRSSLRPSFHARV